MSVSVFAFPLQAVMPDLAAVAVVLVLLSVGVVGMSIRNMFESIMSEEDSDGDELSRDESGDGGLGGGLMDGDDGGDDLGGLDDLGDDDLGGLGDDGFEDVGEGASAGNVDELEHRLDELESEVGSLSSTVNTVRNENEQISESVGEVEENVRKLLDIYEMVTRGVNPFADDIDAGMGGGMGEGSFGLFADEDADDDGVDEDIAEAEAEGFFDDELIEGDDDTDSDAGDVFQESFDDEGFDDGDGFGDEPTEEFADAGGDDDGGGSSFEELKAEYESGEADWAEDDEGAETDDADDGAAFDDELADDDLFDEVIDDEPEADETETGQAETATAETETGQAETATAETGETTDEEFADAGAETKSDGVVTDSADSAEHTAGSDDGKPYLGALPEGFAAELVVVEWLEFLVEEAGVRGTAQAIEFYETIDWIDESVAGELQEYLAGFDGAGEGSLTIDHHTRSLEYIGQLNGDGAAASYGLDGGGAHGIQR